MKQFCKPVSIAVLLVCVWLVTTVFAAEGAGSVAPQSIPVPPAGLWVLGFVLGYFLTYSIRHGSKTQDVFKGFLGLSGAIGGAAGLNFVLTESTKGAGLVAYAMGTFFGFLAYLLIALALATSQRKGKRGQVRFKGVIKGSSPLLAFTRAS